MQLHSTHFITSLAAMTIAIASATADTVVITNQNRSVTIQHMLSNCAENQTVSAEPFAHFNETLVSPLNCSAEGTDAVSQDSIVSSDALVGSGSSTITANGSSSGFVKHTTTSNYSITFQVLDEQPFALTGLLLAAIDGPGGYHAAQASLILQGPSGTVHQTNVDAGYNDWPTEYSQVIDIEGTLQPGFYTLTVKAQNYMDLFVNAGQSADSHSTYEFELVFVDIAPEKPGDLNGDGIVDVFDLIILINSWGLCGANCPADLTGPDGEPDGVVDVFDMIYLINNWG